MTEDDALSRVRAACAAFGFDLDAASEVLVERMLLLEERSPTFEDARRMATYAERIFRHYEAAGAALAFTSVERQTVLLACLFSDIGKTGPAHAGPEARRYVTEAFAVENVRDDTQALAAFLRTYFPTDAEARIASFRGLGIDPDMRLRQFWNLHSDWTLAIAEAARLPAEAVAAAATHHLLEDVNPRAIVGDDQTFTRSFGANAAFDRAEKLVILLDKYDAAKRRGRLSHQQAITWVRDRLAKSARFHDDVTFAELVAAVDLVLGRTDG
jgi:hypothetical protein